MAIINIRVGDDRKKLYEAEAKNQGLSVSEWLRDLADSACGKGGSTGVPVEAPPKSLKPKIAKTAKDAEKQLSEEGISTGGFKMICGIPHYEVKKANGVSDWLPYSRVKR